MSIQKQAFGLSPSGEAVESYLLTNRNGMQAEILTYGLRVRRLLVPDRQGVLGDVVLGYDTLESYFGSDYQGATVGRCANRIGGAEFTLNGETYRLDRNDGENSLHGGACGYHQVVWSVAEEKDGAEPSLTFTHTSPDGDENYPGTLQLKVTYTLTSDNALRLEYEAVSDKATPFNPTNHSYFNLTGDASKKIFDTTLKLNASAYTPVSDELIPTGKIAPVAGTALDFTQGKKLGQDMFAEDHLIQVCGGFDHNFCVDGAGMRLHAEAYEPESGRVMQVYSDMPGIQLYTFNRSDGKIGKQGVPMESHTAFCLETQFYPDSVHHGNFPFAFLQPWVTFRTATVYRFSVK